MLNTLRRTWTATAALALLWATVAPLGAQSSTFTRTVPNRVAETNQEVHQQFPALKTAGGSYKMTGLPTGLTFDPSLRIVSGSPKRVGSWTANYTATDATGRKSISTPVFTVLTETTTTSTLAGGPGGTEPSNAHIIQPVDSAVQSTITVYTDQVLTFHGVSDGGKNPFWDFADGTPVYWGFGPVQHAFHQTGSFLVTFMVAPSVTYEGSVATLEVNVVGPPLPPTLGDLTPSATSLLFGQSVTLSWTVSNATSLTLSPVGSVPVTSTSIVLTPTATTSYQLIATNSAGSASSNIVNVTVAPVSVALSPKPTSVLPNSPTVFSASVSGAVNTGLTWSASGGSLSATTGASVTWTAPVSGGPFTITATSAADPTKSDSVTVNISGVLITVPPANTTVTEGETATFSVTAVGSGTFSYQWKRGGSPVGTNALTYTTPVTSGADNGAKFTVTVSNGTDSQTSAEATLTVQAPQTIPTITGQPMGQTVTAGDTATFSVSATGTGPLSYQWKRNGADLPGETAATLTTPVTILADNGTVYAVTVSNALGSVPSDPATLNVVPPTGASITVPPVNQSVVAPVKATFTVTAAGTPPLSYQWRKNGVAIAGATAFSYQTPATVLADTGSTFSVVVSSPYGPAVTSAAATLTVTPGSAPSIIGQPQKQSVTLNQAATFAVTATGTGPLTYQWKKNGVNIWFNGTSSTYTTAPATSGDNNANYTVVVTNPVGTATSTPGVLSVVPYGTMVWKRDIVYLGAKEVAEVDATGLMHTTLVDHLGSPRLVINSAGAIEAEQKYLPFGELLDQSGSLKTSKGFTNHEATDASGLIYMQARFYGPMYHRFISPDPSLPQKAENPQTWSLYSYVLNNPISNLDPDGLDIKPDSFVGPLKPGDAYASWFKRGIVKRDYWDADNPRTGKGWVGDKVKTRITVHDVGETGSRTDMKSIQQLHMATGFSARVLVRDAENLASGKEAYNDIGYHFGISPEGKVFEGRSLDIKGSHVGGENTGNVGIVLLGTFREGSAIPEAMAGALRDLVQFLQIQYPGIKSDLKTHADYDVAAGGKDSHEAEPAKPILEQVKKH